MAVRHIKAYIKEVEDTYLEMLDTLHELEKSADENVVSPDKVEEMKATMQPLMQNYSRLEYIAYLLNQPNKKEKEKRYQKQNKKLLAKLTNDNQKAVMKENLDVIEKLKGAFKNS